MRINLSTGVRSTISGHCGEWSIMLSSPDGGAEFSVLLTDKDRDKVCAALKAESTEKADNSDYAAALRVWREFCKYDSQTKITDTCFMGYCKSRLNSDEPNCA